MAGRKANFNPGPAALPLDVLKTVQEELIDYQDTGISILESSHRSKEYEAINDSTIELVRELFGLGPEYHVLFLGGGASTQFAMIPMNFVGDNQVGAYIDTGEWASKAVKECDIVAKADVVFSSKNEEYRRVPAPSEVKVPGNAAYLHLCSNNTIKGTQFQQFPDTGSVPLIADMSSDIASRQLDFTKFAMFYAGAQKNLGPSGVTLVVIKDEFLQTARSGLPTMFSYGTHTKSKSLFNTPPVFGVYIMKLVLEWVKKQGGLPAVEQVNREKKDLLYGAMDAAPDFYRGTAENDSRSWMNVTIRLPSEDLEAKFIADGKKEGLLGIKGHRSVGGIRFSLYNAVSLEDVKKAVDFMEQFRKSV
ncbi:MAG: 3-phosphoserine/phosphohydroxythreonine transaminase [Chloroflexota bacterium]